MRTTKARPVQMLEIYRAAMRPLPPVAPTVGSVNRVRLGRDYHVRVDSSDYSDYLVDPAVIGRHVEVTADLARVEVRHEGRRVAAHDRTWAAARAVPATPDSAGSPRGLGAGPGRYDRAFGLLDGGLTDGEVA